jgi:hypothetical protein
MKRNCNIIYYNARKERKKAVVISPLWSALVAARAENEILI